MNEAYKFLNGQFFCWIDDQISINQEQDMKILLLLICISLVFCQSPPVFQSQFSLTFNETAKIITSGTTKGAIYFDATTNRQVVQRQNGNHDRYCGTVYKNTNTPCRHVVVDNKRFLDFPDKKYCCFCCDSTHGCGILAQDWLVKAGAVYQGTEQIDDKGPYQKWYIKGGQDNFYYNKNDSVNTPRRLNQVPEDLMDFLSFTVGKPDESKFNLPSYCTDKCGLLTICAGLRGQRVQ